MLHVAFLNKFKVVAPHFFILFCLDLFLIAFWIFLIWIRTKSFLAEKYKQQLIESEKTKINNLKVALSDLDTDIPAKQFDLVIGKFSNIEQIINQKFNSAEITHSRYMTSTRSVFDSVITNLGDAIIAFKNVTAIDIAYINKRIDQISRQNASSSDEIVSLKKRRAIWEEQNEKYQQLLAQNERALTIIDETSRAVSNSKIQKDGVVEDAELAILSLENLAKRAKRYSS